MMKKNLHLVVGLGKTGYSMARYLKRRHQPFVVYDTRKLSVEDISSFHAEFPEVALYTESVSEDLFNELNCILLSPGIPLDAPFLKKAYELNIPMLGDIECFAREVSKPIIAITGTNGKSTVTTLVGEMAKAAGLNVAVGGNLGEPVLDLLDDEISYDLWVLELSSFQLELTQSLRPLAACILNITPDHLDRHHTLENYIQAKQRIYQQAKYLIYNREDPQTAPQMPSASAQRISFGLNSPVNRPVDVLQWGLIAEGDSFYLAKGETPFLNISDMILKGKHNWQNALAASALAWAAGISLEDIQMVLKRFSGLSHRCQFVRALNEVEWINDSKGTNVGATCSALFGIGDNLGGKIVLILGGLGKGGDFSLLLPAVKQYVRSAVVIGKDAPHIMEVLRGCVPLQYAESLEAAVNCSRAEAKPGDVVLLSPACASFDMFDDYNHRGIVFKQLVDGL